MFGLVWHPQVGPKVEDGQTFAKQFYEPFESLGMPLVAIFVFEPCWALMEGPSKTMVEIFLDLW